MAEPGASRGRLPSGLAGGAPGGGRAGGRAVGALCFASCCSFTFVIASVPFCASKGLLVEEEKNTVQFFVNNAFQAKMNENSAVCLDCALARRK